MKYGLIKSRHELPVEKYIFEKDIEDLEKYISFSKKSENFSHDTDWKWNKELGEKIERLIKAYKELEKERQIVGMLVKNKRDGKIGVVLHQWESGSIAVLENISPRVINTHDSWNTLEIVTDEVKQTQTEYESIPISLVEEKIEELNRKEQELQNSISDEEREEYSDANISFELMDIEIRRSIL